MCKVVRSVPGHAGNFSTWDSKKIDNASYVKVIAICSYHDHDYVSSNRSLLRVLIVHQHRLSLNCIRFSDES